MIHVVIGPPCAGKSTYVQEHADDEDVTIDFDAMATALGSRVSHGAPEPIRSATFSARQAAIDRCIEDGLEAWIIHSNPRPEQMERYTEAGAEVVRLPADIETCLARAEDRPDPEQTKAIIREWFGGKRSQTGGGMKETRTATMEATDEPLVLVGHPIVFEQVTTINDPAGPYFEVIDRHALDHADLSDVTLRIEHDTQRIPLARTPRTLNLEVDRDGLNMVAHLAETRRDVWEAVQRGDITGLSFGFVVDEGGSSYDHRTNTRRITSIRKVYECSLCAHPAYQTSVEARSQMEQAEHDEHERDMLLCLCNEILLNSKE